MKINTGFASVASSDIFVDKCEGRTYFAQSLSVKIIINYGFNQYGWSQKVEAFGHMPHLSQGKDVTDGNSFDAIYFIYIHKRKICEPIFRARFSFSKAISLNNSLKINNIYVHSHLFTELSSVHCFHFNYFIIFMSISFSLFLIQSISISVFLFQKY